MSRISTPATSPGPNEDRFEHTRTGVSVKALQDAFRDNLFFTVGRPLEIASKADCYYALAMTVRDHMLLRWVATSKAHMAGKYRTVCYLSAEYLPGPQLANNLINLGIQDNTRAAMASLGLDFDEILAQEEEPGLGNGGLGRLAACFMDSLATLEIPAIGYGIRYEHGIFNQTIVDGWQVEVTDNWLHYGNPWEIRRPKICFDIKIGGHTERYQDDKGNPHVRWVPVEVIRGVANDTAMLGHGVTNTNLLRLWSAEATESFDFQVFNKGDYYGAVQHKVRAETVSKVLYPNDDPETGKHLRLVQQYFFVSCSLQDMLRIHLRFGEPIEHFFKYYVVQLNDTHPAIGVAELMRLLIDEHGLAWDAAWDITTRTFAYTNHTLLPEALEKWQIALFREVLPRHLEIIYEINARFLDQVRMHFLHDPERVARMSIIDESGPRYVRMAHLACVGCFAINGVAALHSELLRNTILRDFYEMWPEKFHSKTNGVTPRRFLKLCNPGLADLISSRLGNDRWVRDLDRLRELEHHIEDAEFRAEWRRVKRARKQGLADQMQRELGIACDPDSLFDVQAKRIHEYKRQHLKVLHIVTLYNRIKRNPRLEVAPRTFIFGGKAAPGYFMAKLMIKLINAVGAVVNCDPDVAGRLKVVFVPNFSVKNGHRIYPAADLSEQISTAGMEASGTGNMKFSMNGALTIGTLDGANIEIREEVGAENFFLFGLNVEEVQRLKREGYRPRDIYDGNPELREVIDLIASGVFAHGDVALFKPLVDSLIDRDEYLLFADYDAYIQCQDEVGRAYLDPERWTRMSILNVARMGKFSSDRTIREYDRDTWKAGPLPIRL